MRRNVLTKIFAFILLNTTIVVNALAHPGHTMHDAENYAPGHFLSDPYHLSITVVVGALLFLGVIKARKFLSSIRDQHRNGK